MKLCNVLYHHLTLLARKLMTYKVLHVQTSTTKVTLESNIKSHKVTVSYPSDDY